MSAGSRGIRLEDRILIAGQTGKGKTTLARYLVERLQPIRVIVFDPKDALEFPGVEKCRTLEQLTRHLRDPLVHYVPSGFDRDQLEEACQIVWETPGPYVWWVEDVAELTNPGYCPAGLRLCAVAGRAKKKMLIVTIQRLAETHPVFRSQSEHIFIFVPPPILLDLRTVAGNIGREAFDLDRQLRELQEEHGLYSHLWFVRDTDELRRCAPLPVTGQAATAPVEEGVETPACEDSVSG